jgi:DNA recombination protein RmuC
MELWIPIISVTTMIAGGLIIFETIKKLEAQLKVETDKKIELEKRIRYVEKQLLQYRNKCIKLSKVKEDIVKINREIIYDKDKQKNEIHKFNEIRKNLENSFKSISLRSLFQNNKTFLDLAQIALNKKQKEIDNKSLINNKYFENIVGTITENLSTLNTRLSDLEKIRLGTYQTLKTQINDMIKSQRELKTETSNLSNALRSPNIRGRWGEIQLKRIIEISGLSSHCDFISQPKIDRNIFLNEENVNKPDMVINLPEQKQIIIDSKVPLSSYLDSIKAKSEEERQQHMYKHIQQIKLHMNNLSQKSYWSCLALKNSPEFVIMFLPGESFLHSALEEEQSLIEMGVQKKVILTTPSSLIALLHAVAYGWQQKNLSENANEITILGQNLYKKISDMSLHLSKLGRDIKTCSNTYNKLIGNLEYRVLPNARKFKKLKLVNTSDSKINIESISTEVRDIKSRELFTQNNHI